MFNNASNIDASHSTFSEVHRDQYIHSRGFVQGDCTVNTIVHGNQVFQGTLGLENLHRASVPGAAFDSIDRHPAPTCLPGTRFELLARLAEWVDSPNCDQQICWLSGLAGSGKSAVAQSIADKYASQRRLAASFFFSRKEILRRKAQGFFPTLACQMLVFAPSIRPALLGALDADATIPTKVLLEQARRLVQEPIMSSASSIPNPVLVVVDSLDECDDVKMASEIVHLLSGILRHCRWPLKVLFTSRAEPHLVQTFQHPELRNTTRSLQLQDFGVDDDIRVYLRHSFGVIRESMNTVSVNNYPLSWPSEDEIEMVVQKAAGLFIFATTVVKYVSIDYSSPVVQLQSVLQVLQNVASAESAFVHSPLDTLYLDALHTIPDAEKLHLILGLVVFAFRPLSTHGLNDLLWKSQFDASYIVKNLCSVLVISDSDIENDGAVQIYHTSFRDFLTASSRSRQYFVDPIVFHSTLARACLELMIRHLTVDMCHLGDPSILNCDIENLDKRCKLRIKEGVRYACRWFAHHLSQVPWDGKLDNALVLSLQGFASQYLLNWIEVLSLTGELDSAVFSLREVLHWLKYSPKPYEETLSLFRDAERLVLMYYDPIQQAALQVYYSLPCAPTCAQIRTNYAHELKNKFVITHGLDDDWKVCFRSVSTGAAIRSLAISTSGRLIASAGDTLGVQLWDTLTGRNTGHFRGNAGTSTCPVIFSPSGDYVAIGYNTGAIDFWDVTTGQRLLDPVQSPQNASVMVLVFSQNSLFIASGTADATVHVWDVSTRSLKHSLAYHEGPVLCLLFSSSGGLIASGSQDTSIVTSDVHSGQRVRVFQGHTSKVNSISFSPDSGSIASGSDDQTVRLWDTRTGVCLRTFAGTHKKPIRQVWITADNKYIVSVCNMDVYMWETSSPNRKSPQHIWSVNHYYRKFATMFPAWYSKLFKFIPAGLVGRILETDNGTVLYTVPSPNGKTMYCAYGSSLLLLEHSAPRKGWSKVRHPLETPSTLDEPPLVVDTPDVTAVAATPDMTLLVTSDGNDTIKIWSTPSRSNWKTVQVAFKKAAEGFWPSPDGHNLLVKPMDGLQLTMPAGTLSKNLETGGDALAEIGAVPSPDSRYFAYWAEYPWSVDDSYSIHIYNAYTGIRLKRIPSLFNITCGLFSVESDLFACAHGDGVVQIWELPSMLCKTTIMTGHAAITALEFLPGNITLVVGSDEGCAEIRLVEDGDVVHRIECSRSKVSALAVPNGAFIVIVGHEGGSIFVWDPSYPNVAPHCLSPKIPKETSDGAVSDPDGVDLIKFTEGYRSFCTRSLRGVICTWDLTHCLAEYAGQAKETLAKSAVTDTITTNISTQSSNPPVSDPSDGSTGLSMLDNAGAQDDTVVPPDSTPVESASLVPQNEVSEPERTTPQTTTEELTTHDTPNTSPSVTSSPSCPHLVSRSDSHIVYDTYFRSTYSVDGREGWVYRGSRRMFWLPSDLRPDSPTGLSAFEDRLVIATKLGPIVFFDLRPMVDSTLTLRSKRRGQ